MRVLSFPVALSAGLVTLLLSLPAAAGLSRGPILQQVTTDSALVVFEGTELGTPQLDVTSEDGADMAATCQCQPPHCSCSLVDLAPDTGYAYALTIDGAPSEEGDFRTAPVGPVTFSFAVHGDNRSDHLSHTMVVENLLEEDFAFVVNTGDMVSDGEVEEQWDEFFAIEGPLLRSVPIYPAVGNHEEEDGEIPIFERTFELPAEASGSGEESYYSFGYSNAHFVVIDDFVEVHPWYECLLIGKLYDNCLTSDQLAWLNVDLAKAAANPAIDHVFVFAHEGPYSSKEGRTGSAAMRDLLPLFAKSKVKVIFSGHDHYFEHGISGNGIDYVISGGGGAPLYDIAPGLLSQIAPHDVVINKSAHNYQVVTVSGPHIEVVTRDVDELTVLETFEVGPPPTCTVVDDCAGEETGSCEGQFECIDFACVWVCDAPPPCETESDCPEPPENVCPGAWQCSLAHTCEWLCDPAPECTLGVDCLDKGPLNDCVGGIWQCVDEVCEWSCPPPMDPEPDVAPQPDTAEEPGEVQSDADPDSPEAIADDAQDSDDVPGAADAADTGATGQYSGGSSSGGCQATSLPGTSGTLLLTLLLLLALARVISPKKGLVTG